MAKYSILGENELQTAENGTDEVEKSLELLDKVLSEFEESENTEPVEPESPSQGHQSEDDGYMSMNGRRTKFVPDFLPTAEVSLTLDGSSKEKFSPPTPEEAEAIISDLIPISENIIGENNYKKIDCLDLKLDDYSNNLQSVHDLNLSNANESEAESSNFNSFVSIASSSVSPHVQTTLPKTRPTTVFPSRYASLPSANTHKCLDNENPNDIDYVGRKFIGIGINDVHNAVLRRGARMPETIINEHPVTIYPGPLNQKRVQNRPILESLEKQQENFRKVKSSEIFLQDEDTKFSDVKIESPKVQPSSVFILHKDDFIKGPISPLSPLTPNSPSKTITPYEIKISIQTMDNLMNSRKSKISELKMNRKNKKKCQLGNHFEDEDEDEFSDDSLEENSLPPPAPPQIVPPPPSLSAPVTPSKRHSIAWEVNLDDLSPSINGNSSKVCENKQFKDKIKGDSKSQSHSSICSSPGQSSASNKLSSDWPDPPEIPICSTEDEATSIYSDSEGVIPQCLDITDGNGTYIIRKGRRRQRIDDVMVTEAERFQTEIKDNIREHCKFVPSPVYPPSMNMPNSRHSIDLGASGRDPLAPYSHNSPLISSSSRSRLSLDLNPPSPIVSIAKLSSITTSPSIHSPVTNKNSAPTSPIVSNTTPLSSRYSEFKTYSSTFDGLQALESHANTSTSNTKVSVCKVNVSSSPENLMRVSSLPAINPQNQLAESVTTPRRELAPPIEEDEEDSEGNRAAPLRQIESNISALLRGDIQITQVSSAVSGRNVSFRSGVHKSESAKEMLLSQNYFGPLPDSPHSSSEPESDEFPPLPPSPLTDENLLSHNLNVSSRNRAGNEHSYRKDYRAPAVPPHATSMGSLKTRSMDAGFSKSYRNASLPMPLQQHSLGLTSSSDLQNCNKSSRPKHTSHVLPKRIMHSPREERRLQTSCSLPETPIFQKTKVDLQTRTPHRRVPDLPGSMNRSNGSRHNSVNSTSIVGIGCSTISSTGSRSHHRGFNHTIQANGALMPLSGLPARGWRRNARASASTEHLDRLQGSMAWEMGTTPRKPTTLPSNMEPPKFFNHKSPRDALRRVTSLLINRKGNNSTVKTKDSKKDKMRKTNHDITFEQSLHQSSCLLEEVEVPPQPKKKGFFKSFWKKSKHYSLEQN